MSPKSDDSKSVRTVSTSICEERNKRVQSGVVSSIYYHLHTLLLKGFNKFLEINFI